MDTMLLAKKVFLFQILRQTSLYMVTRVVTQVRTRSYYGNALHYGLCIYEEFEKLPYP